MHGWWQHRAVTRTYERSILGDGLPVPIMTQSENKRTTVPGEVV